MAQVRIADLPTTSLIDPESFVIIERPGFADGTFKSTVGDLQRVITVSAKVEQFNNITRITIDDINRHTEEEIFTPIANIRNNGDNTVTITITDAAGTTEDTLIRDGRSIDPVLTPGSNNLVTSGTVYAAFQELSATINKEVDDKLAAYTEEIDGKIADFTEEIDQKIEDFTEQMDEVVQEVEDMVKDTYERMLVIESVVYITYNVGLTDESAESLTTEDGEILVATEYGSISEMRARDGQPEEIFYSEGYLFSSLSEAILKAAPTGGTVILLGNTSNKGLSVPSGSSFTLDLNGYTLDVVHPGAGSPGTETNGFQLLKGSNITIRNGKLNFNDDQLKMGIQNYSNLTLDNVKITGGPTIQYVVSNNYGYVTFKNKTEIHAYPGQVAFDAWYGMSAVYDHPGVNVTIEDNSVVVDGKVEFGKARRASITDFEDNASITCPSEYILSITELTSPCAWDYNGDTKTFRYQSSYTELLDESENHVITQQEEDVLAPIEHP